MGKAKGSFIVLVAAVALSLSSCTQGVRGDKTDYEGATPRGETKGKTEGSAPEKKPHLKYWDPYECGC